MLTIKVLSASCCNTCDKLRSMVTIYSLFSGYSKTRHFGEVLFLLKTSIILEVVRNRYISFTHHVKLVGTTWVTICNFKKIFGGIFHSI